MVTYLVQLAPFRSYVSHPKSFKHHTLIFLASICPTIAFMSEKLVYYVLNMYFVGHYGCVVQLWWYIRADLPSPSPLLDTIFPFDDKPK